MNAHSIPLALHSHILCWVVTALMTLVCAPVAADTLDDIQQRGELVWGADQEGGGPYVFPDEDNPDVLRVVSNAVRWAAPTPGALPVYGNTEPLN